MTTGQISVEDLTNRNVDDLIYVCSSKRLNDPLHQKGVALKKPWLEEMLERYGSIAKIAYLRGKPVAQLTFYPEEASPIKAWGRKGVIHIQCIYNPSSETRHLGIGARLLQSLIEDCKRGTVCGLRSPCRFIVTEPFSTGEGLPLPQFFQKRGFKQSEMEPGVMYLPISEPYQPKTAQASYASLPEDRGRAIVFYSPTCEFSYPFAVQIADSIREVSPTLPVDLVNDWERPEESLKRKNCQIIVNSKPIRTFFLEKEKFQREIRNALSDGAEENKT